MSLKSAEKPNATKLRFSPPKEKEKKIPRYASYGGGLMKTHTSIGAAKQSLSNRVSYVDNSDRSIPYYSRQTKWHEGFILEMVYGEWFILYHVPERTALDDLPWKKDVWVNKTYGWTQFYEPSHDPDRYTRFRKAYPMTRDEYADWRVRVERERLGVD